PRRRSSRRGSRASAAAWAATCPRRSAPASRRRTSRTSRRGSPRVRRTTELTSVCAIAFAVIALAARGAMAEPKDAQAQKLADEAMAKDYFATKLDSAEKKLRRALAVCGDSGCSSKVLAKIHLDLATVEIAGLGKLSEGKADLAEALKDDPSITLDNDYVTPAME